MPKELSVLKNKANQWFASYLQKTMKDEPMSQDTKNVIESAARSVYAERLKNDAEFCNKEVEFCKGKHSMGERKQHYNIIMAEIAEAIKSECAIRLQKTG